MRVSIEQFGADDGAHAHSCVIIGMDQRVVDAKEILGSVATRRGNAFGEVELGRIDDTGWAIIFLRESGRINQRLEGRADLAPGLHRTVVLADRKIARTDHGADRTAGGVHGEESALKNVVVGQARVRVAKPLA